MTELYVDPGHRIPDEDWAGIVHRAQEIREQADSEKAGGASSPAGKIIDLRGRSNKHSGVSGIPTQLLVLHSAECPLRGGYALSLTEWAITSGVIASWQRFIDPFHRVYMIEDDYAAWHASEANPMSIGWEQAGYARFSRAEWTTPDGMLQMESLAYDMAQVAKRDGIPPVWLTTAQVTAITTYGDRKTKGFCLHRQIDPESRTDPGDGYPYELLMAKIKRYMGLPAIAPAGTTAIKPNVPAKESEVPLHKRVSSKSGHTRLAKGQAWFLKDKTGNTNENYAPLGAGSYDIDLFVQGTGLPTGETITVKFMLVAGAKRSGYYSQEIHGSADGSYAGRARFKMPIGGGGRIEASVTSSKESAYIDLYAADVYAWKA